MFCIVGCTSFHDQKVEFQYLLAWNYCWQVLVRKLRSVCLLPLMLFIEKRENVAFWKQSYNMPLPSSKNPHFQNEAKCSTFLVEMSFICMRMKNHFHIEGWAPNLVLIQRLGELGNGLLYLITHYYKALRGYRLVFPMPSFATYFSCFAKNRTKQSFLCV